MVEKIGSVPPVEIFDTPPDPNSIKTFWLGGKIIKAGRDSTGLAVDVTLDANQGNPPDSPHRGYDSSSIGQYFVTLSASEYDAAYKDGTIEIGSILKEKINGQYMTEKAYELLNPRTEELDQAA